MTREMPCFTMEKVLAGARVGGVRRLVRVMVGHIRLQSRLVGAVRHWQIARRLITVSHLESTR